MTFLEVLDIEFPKELKHIEDLPFIWQDSIWYRVQNPFKSVFTRVIDLWTPYIVPITYDYIIYELS